jgi:uncharacterized protein YceK
MKRLSCLFLMITLLNGCVTSLALDAARGVDRTKENGEQVVEKKPNPAAYALLPITVAVDAVIAGLWAAAMF